MIFWFMPHCSGFAADCATLVKLVDPKGEMLSQSWEAYATDDDAGDDDLESEFSVANGESLVHKWWVNV